MMNLFSLLPRGGSIGVAFALIVSPDYKIVRYLYEVALRAGFGRAGAVKEAAYTFYDIAGLNPKWEEFERRFMGLETRDRKPRVVNHDNQTQAVCKLSLYTRVMEVAPPFGLMDTADPMRTGKRLKAYVDNCIQAYEALPANSTQRKLLDSIKVPKGIPGDLPNLTLPHFHGPMNHEEYIEMRKRRAFRGMKKANLQPRRMNVSEIDPEWVREGMRKSRILPVKPDHIPNKEVLTYLLMGKVAIFDATKLLPHHVFNKSLVDIANMHNDTWDEIPMYKMRSGSAAFGWDSLKEVKQRLERYNKSGELYHPEMVPLPRYPDWQPSEINWTDKEMQKMKEEVDEEVGYDADAFVHNMLRAPGQTTTNLRRLPKLNVSLEDALGNPDWLERSWSMFWAGSVGSYWHNDEPDNLIICTNKEVNIGVFTDMSDTDLLNGKKNYGDAPHPEYFDLFEFHPDEVTDEWLQEQPWIWHYPYIRIRLKAGQGVTIPSRMYHSVWSEHTDRLVLNAFLIPKFGALDNAPRPKNSWYDNQDKTYLAIFHLKLSAIFRLWDTQKVGGFFSGTKLEIM